jgi:hypothetical protein
MKRSEARYRIHGILLNINRTYSVMDQAEEVLRTLEELGMLPPEVRGKYGHVPSVTPTGNLDYSWIREWEKE